MLPNMMGDIPTRKINWLPGGGMNSTFSGIREAESNTD